MANLRKGWIHSWKRLSLVQYWASIVLELNLLSLPTENWWTRIQALTLVFCWEMHTWVYRRLGSLLKQPYWTICVLGNLYVVHKTQSREFLSITAQARCKPTRKAFNARKSWLLKPMPYRFGRNNKWHWNRKNYIKSCTRKNLGKFKRVRKALATLSSPWRCVMNNLLICLVFFFSLLN